MGKAWVDLLNVMLLKAGIGVILLLGLFFSHPSNANSSWTELSFHGSWIEGSLDQMSFLSIEEKELVQKAHQFLQQSPSMTILHKDGNYLLYVSCDPNLWIWENGAWEKMVRSDLYGQFCHSFPFQDKDHVYLLGKYGFWEGHFDLISISKKERKMSWVQTANQPLDYHTIGTFKLESGVVTLFGFNRNPRKSEVEFHENGYFLDWDSKEWKEIAIHWDSNFEKKWEGNGSRVFMNFAPIDLQDYGVIQAESQVFGTYDWYILDKKSLDVYLVPTQAYLFSPPFILVKGEGNDFSVYNPKLDRLLNLNADFLVKEGKRIGRLDLSPSLLFDNWVFIAIFLVVGLALSYFGWIGYRVRKRKKAILSVSNPDNSETWSPEVSSLIQKLLPISTSMLAQEQMDDVLGFSNIKNEDLKKVKRSRIIRQLNDECERFFGLPCIFRIRNEEDRRMIIYQVGDIEGLMKNKKNVSS